MYKDVSLFKQFDVLKKRSQCLDIEGFVSCLNITSLSHTTDHDNVLYLPLEHKSIDFLANV